jgi:hypothetical protein
MLSALFASIALSSTCSPIDFGELAPTVGSQFTYALWRDNETQPGLYRIEITRSRPGDVRAEDSFFLINEQWTEPAGRRVVAWTVLRDADSFNGIAERQLEFAELTPPLEVRTLDINEELRIPVRQSVPGRFGMRQRNEDAYVLRHIGCSALVNENGDVVTTRMLEVAYPRYVSRRGNDWQLRDRVQVYHIPEGAPWFYAVHSAGNHPMQQGTILDGYRAQ